jgi:hypothetical protein
VVLDFVETSTDCGLANAVINNASANKRHTNSKCLNFGSQDAVSLKPFKLDIFSVAVCFLFLKTYHAIAAGIASNNQNSSLFKN